MRRLLWLFDTDTFSAVAAGRLLIILMALPPLRHDAKDAFAAARRSPLILVVTTPRHYAAAAFDAIIAFRQALIADADLLFRYTGYATIFFSA